MPDIEEVRRWSVSSDLIANLVEGLLETLFGDRAVQVAGKNLRDKSRFSAHDDPKSRLYSFCSTNLGDIPPVGGGQD